MPRPRTSDDEMSIGDVYRAMREHRQEQRAERLPGRAEEILLLSEDGFSVRKLTPFHYRVNNRLDLFPTNRRFHDIKSGRRGSYQVALTIAEQVLGIARGNDGTHT